MSKPTAARLLNRLPAASAPRKTTPAKALKRTDPQPTDAKGWLLQARQLIEGGNVELAREAANKAQGLGDDSAALWLLYGRIETQANNTRIAIGHFRKAIERDENLADAHHGLASALQRVDEWNNALRHIEVVLRLEPQRLTAKSLKALILIGLHRHTEAIELFEELLDKDHPQAAYAHLTNLGNAQRDVGRLAEAEKSYRKAVKLRPTDVNSRSNLLTLLHYMPERTAAEIEQVCREIGALFAKDVKSARPVPQDKAPNKRLRVGMFSDGFRQHPVGAMTATALEQLVKQGVEIHAYSTTSVSDYITERIKGFCTRWLVVTNLTDDQFVQQIREDEIDILIDLAGYGAGTHMRALTQEPAPLIVKWVGGLINTTGLESIDYLITDAIESPPETDHTYTEKLIRMPDDYICYMPPARVPNVGPLPAARNGYITFGCFNNPTKINPVVLAEWAGLLKMVPASRLLLKSGAYDSPVMRKMVTDTMLAHGVPEERIQFSGYSIHYQLFAAYNDIDIALDPWPYSGGLTTCEAMLMGVPVVTLPGPTFAGRHSATHLVNAGLPELVASDWDEYRARAVDLAGDLDNLANIRANLRESLLKSPVCDATRFAGHLANAFRAIWQRYCEGKAPAALHMAKDGSVRFEGEDAAIKLLQPDLPPEERGFQWQLPGKLIAVDSSGRLLDRPSTEGMLSLKMLETVVFDPVGNIRGHAFVARDGVHYQPGLSLGDGQPATLHDCLDPQLSGLLRPLDADATAPTAGGRVLFQRPIATIALDRIDGLPTVDWLLLDGRNASTTILEHGVKTLANTLLIDASVVFLATHTGQPTLADITDWASRNGFRLHRLHDATMGHASALPGSRTLPPTALLHADALFVPNDSRLAQLDAGERQKLACILHLGYGLEDLAYEILAGDDAGLTFAQDYLDDRHVAKALGHDAAIGVHEVRNRNEAGVTVQLVRNLHHWSAPALDVLLKRSLSMFTREPHNHTAHFLLSHGLLAKGELQPADDDTPHAATQRDLAARLHAMGWQGKGNLYSVWLAEMRELQDRANARISVVLASASLTGNMVSSLLSLREQGQDEIEIVLVNRGGPSAAFESVLSLADLYVETRGATGDCIARNLAAVYAKAPILLFVDSNGVPEPDLIQAHLRAHANRNAVAVRGAYRLRDGGSMPALYDLGTETIPSLPTLEGNASFAREAFVAVKGWGDYLLGEHAGIDIGTRLINHGFDEARQLYVPDAMVLLDGVLDAAKANDKYATQRAPWLLLDAWGSTKSVPPAQRAAAATATPVRTLPAPSDTSEKQFVHICYNNMHVQGLISTLDDDALGKDFVHRILIEKARSVPGYDNDIRANENAYFFDSQTDLQRVVELCLQPNVQGVFVHGLFFDWQKALIKQIGKQVKVIWAIWGGDLYNPIAQGAPITDVVAHIHAVATVTEGDYRLFCETYGKKPKLTIAYPSSVEMDSIALPAAKPNVIFVGNSGDPGNLHIEILEKLAAKKDIKDYEIVLPVSYNFQPEYRKELTARIEKLGLTKQTRLLTEFIEPKQYLTMLGTAKYFITAHQRQQALGNLVASLYFGNATVLREKIKVNGQVVANPSWDVLTQQLQAKPLSYDEFADCKRLSELPALPADVYAAQQAALLERCGRAGIVKLMKAQFEQAARFE